MNSLRTEHELLITIARRELGPDQAKQLKALVSKNVDWEYLISTARQHGLVHLLQKHTYTFAGELLPSHVRTQLKQELVENTQSVLYLNSQALKVINLFQQHELRAALFKGSLLSQQVYGELALRQAGDIDILVSKDDFANAKELLISLGFEMCPNLNAAQQASHLAHHCESQFMRDDWFTVVDLHWDLAPRSFAFGLAGEEVLSRLRAESFSGSVVHTFSTEDLLLYQAMHGAKHLWRKLEWISSLAEIVGAIEPSMWSTVIERTMKSRATRILGLGLRLVENVFQIDAPKEVLAVVDPNGSMKEFANELFSDIFNLRGSVPDSLDSNLYNLKVMDRKRDAINSGLRALLVPTLSDWEALSLPVSLHSLYYALRPLRLSKNYSSTLLRKLTHKTSALIS